MKFEWDEDKNLANIEKHGISFEMAVQAFLDPKRKIRLNTKHSGTEMRYFCLGMVDKRFSLSGSPSEAVKCGYSEPDTGENGENCMSKAKGYTNAPADIAEELENSVAIDDFLPSPGVIAESLKKQKTVPVTMKLKKETIDRYKRFADKKGIKYQTFVSTILDTYAKYL